MVKAIQIMGQFKGKLARDTVSTIINNVHHGVAAVRDEAA
jgi:rRNA processing protein Krr1/Pno1